MGRYYSGDIEGKFMFAVQSSDAPERFCAKESEPMTIEYVVEYDDYEDVKSAVESVDKESISKVEKMFSENDYYNNDTMQQYGVTNYDLKEYADYQLGKQILEYLEREESDCYIYAEL